MNDSAGRFVEIEEDYRTEVPSAEKRPGHFKNAQRTDISWTITEYQTDHEDSDMSEIIIRKHI